MSTTVPTAVPAQMRRSGSAGAAQVEVLVRGRHVSIDCPPWCTDGHAERYAFLEDVSHRSDSIALSVPTFEGPAEQALIARIVQWPFAGDQTAKPYVSLEATSDGDCANLDEAAALAVSDQMIAHGHAFRALIGIISGGAQ